MLNRREAIASAAVFSFSFSLLNNSEASNNKEALPFDPFFRVRNLFTIDTSTEHNVNTTIPNHGYLPKQKPVKEIPTFKIGNAIDWNKSFSHKVVRDYGKDSYTTVYFYTANSSRDDLIHKGNFYELFKDGFQTKIKDDCWLSLLSLGSTNNFCITAEFANAYFNGDNSWSLKNVDDFDIYGGLALCSQINTPKKQRMHYIEELNFGWQYDKFFKEELTKCLKPNRTKRSYIAVIVPKNTKHQRICTYKPNSLIVETSKTLNREGIFGHMEYGVGLSGDIRIVEFIQ